MKKTSNIFSIVALLPLISLCQSGELRTTKTHELNPNFGDYWYQGKAELASYELEQVRYGEVRNGHAVLIFVTEDFSKSKQVKLDDPSQNSPDILKVMKLNATRKFITGVYPYSTMTSVFTPIYLNDNAKTVKLSTSSQEWCGHTHLQVNLKGNKYSIQSNSYFEREGDSRYTVQSVIMEDELWTRIRLNPNELPIGEFKMLPGSLYCRFKHVAFNPEKVVANFKEGSDSTRTYHIEYANLGRTLIIEFEKTFPYKIQRWEETYPEGEKLMTTRATLKKAIQLDYWNKNKSEEAYLRTELGLD